MMLILGVLYWWLAYSYENYLPSCAICNQKYKKDAFELEDENLQLAGPDLANLTEDQMTALAAVLTVDPVDNTSGKDLEEFKSELSAEKALLINPYFDDPAIYLAFRPILENKEIVVVPAKLKYKKIVKACQDYFGINRQELLDLRFQVYCLYMTYRHTLNDPGISANTRTANQNRLTQMSADKSPYAGMIRYFDTQDLDDLPWDFNIQIDF